MALITIGTDFLRKVSALPYPRSEYVVLYIENYCENGPGDVPTSLFDQLVNHALSYADGQCKLDEETGKLTEDEWEGVLNIVDGEYIAAEDFIKVQKNK